MLVARVEVVVVGEKEAIATRGPDRMPKLGRDLPETTPCCRIRCGFVLFHHDRGVGETLSSPSTRD